MKKIAETIGQQAVAQLTQIPCIKPVDEGLSKEGDVPTIGILLCKNKDKLVAEYALSDIQKPMGVSEYQLTQSLPENLQSKLSSIDEIENELGGEG